MQFRDNSLLQNTWKVVQQQRYITIATKNPDMISPEEISSKVCVPRKLFVAVFHKTCFKMTAVITKKGNAIGRVQCFSQKMHSHQM